MNSVSKKPIIGGIILAAIIGLVAVGAQINPEYTEDETRPNSEVWSTRIVDSDVSFDGSVGGGMLTNAIGDTHKYLNVSLDRQIPHKFEFVPMGDSPRWIKISIVGSSHINSGIMVFSQMFVLEKTLIDTGISKYYTWDYIQGDRSFQISTQQCPNQSTCVFDITVELPPDDLEGSVSISLSRVSI